MWWYACILLIAVLKAAADTMADHYEGSWFDRTFRNPRFWSKTESSKVTPLLKIGPLRTKYRLDGWHLANSGWIAAACGAPLLYRPNLWPELEFALAGTGFILVFNLFYNKLFK